MKRSAPGFSLVEVVVALGVIAFGLLAILGLFPSGLQSGRASIQETRANHLADQIFATFRSQPFNAVNLSLLAGTSTIDLSTENTASGSRPLLHATYDGAFVTTSDYFQIEVTFRTAPDGLTAGSANEIHLRITSRESGAQAMNYATIIAAQ